MQALHVTSRWASSCLQQPFPHGNACFVNPPCQPSPSQSTACDRSTTANRPRPSAASAFQPPPSAAAPRPRPAPAATSCYRCCHHRPHYPFPHTLPPQEPRAPRSSVWPSRSGCCWGTRGTRPPAVARGYSRSGWRHPTHGSVRAPYRHSRRPPPPWPPPPLRTHCGPVGQKVGVPVPHSGQPEAEVERGVVCKCRTQPGGWRDPGGIPPQATCGSGTCAAAQRGCVRYQPYGAHAHAGGDNPAKGLAASTCNSHLCVQVPPAGPAATPSSAAQQVDVQ